MDRIRIRSENNEDGSEENFVEYLAKKFDVNQSIITQHGKIRSITSLTQRPMEIHLAYLLACESYTESSYPVNHRLTSYETYKKTRIDYAQYNSNQIYAAEKNIVYIVNNKDDDRLTHECLMVFIMELLMFQLCAIYSSYDEITRALDEEYYSLDIVGRINQRFSLAARLWDVDNFTYLASKQIFEGIAKEFRIDQIKSEHAENFDIYEKIATAKSQKATERYVFVFTIISGFAAFSALTNLFSILITQGPLNTLLTQGQVLEIFMKISQETRVQEALLSLVFTTLLFGIFIFSIRLLKESKPKKQKIARVLQQHKKDQKKKPCERKMKMSPDICSITKQAKKSK
jgi:hypothetical protein